MIGRMVSLVLVLMALGGLARPGPAADPPSAPAKQPQDQVRRLIGQLGDKDYFVRRRAETELAALGFEAFDALNEATASDDLEIAARARYLLRLLRVEWLAKDDPQAVRAVLQNYEAQAPEQRRAKMKLLAAMPNDEGVPALCRLVRLEKSSLLSKQAAIELLRTRKPELPPGPPFARAVQTALAGSRRAAALWLAAYLRFGKDPAADAAQWTRLVEAEQELLRASPDQTSPELVTGLLRFQIARLRKLGRNDEAVAAIRRLIQMETGDAASLTDLLDWLTEQKAWKAVDELAERFGPKLGSDPKLLYRLAEARLIQGDKVKAEDLAQQAFRLNPGNNPGAAGDPVLEHLAVAEEHLRHRGLFAWAKREYRYVITTTTNRQLTLVGQFILSEMLHDQGEDLEAAAVLDDVLKAPGGDNLLLARGRRPGEIRSRRCYFLACHAQSTGEPAKYRQLLDDALKHDGADLDVLIAYYRLPGLKPEEQRKTVQLIEKTAQAIEEKIAEDAGNASLYNHFAWLVGNTTGDLDKALEYSQKSLELVPDTGGYYDTLAHVYFTRRDYANAVKYQTKAAELEPHSGLIARQLAVFRKALDAEKKEKPKR